MNFRITTNEPQFINEYEDVLRAFSPYVTLSETGAELVCNVSASGDSIRVEVGEVQNLICAEYPVIASDAMLKKRMMKRYSKRDLYCYLSNVTKVKLPYGSLTGIRPTKLYYELAEEGKNPYDELVDFFKVSPGKAGLVRDIVRTQEGIYKRDTDCIDWFVNIPFCPSKCHYCSFISQVIGKRSNLAGYTEAILRDIDACKGILPRRRAIYVGGGTPTSIPPYMLKQILAALGASGAEEFTVEAGRPDTINEEIAHLLGECGVTRISINPQTFKQETLDMIGRKHTVKDIFAAYDCVRKVGGFDVNMDFITMLPGESFEDFARSVDTAVDLAPENITVHSLSIKRGSIFAENGYDNFSDGLAAKMSDYARDKLQKAGYEPYYMYRQKNTTGRLENVGYTLKGKACVYNVDIMEETHGIYASGAGAISKRLFANGLIERLAEVKDIDGYIARIDEMISKKITFFS